MSKNSKFRRDDSKEGTSDKSESKEFRSKTSKEDGTRGKSKTNSRRSRRPGNNGNNGSNSSKANTSVSESITNWVNRNPDQVNATGNISFMNATGSPLDIFDWQGGFDNDEERTGVPGIFRMGYIPTFGNPQGGNDAINLAMARIYAFVRDKNSGSRNYYAPDLFKYFLQMDSGYSLLAFLIRIYGIVNTFSPINMYTPRAILSTMNIDYDSIITNKPRLFAQINRMAANLNSFTVPNLIPAFQQHFEMASRIYADAPSGYAHIYMYVPEGYYKMVQATAKPNSNKRYFDLELMKFNTDPFDGAGGTYGVNGIKQSQGALTLTDLIAISNDLIDALYQDPDILIMSGDIRKCTTDWFIAPSIDQDYQIGLTYDEGMLIRIMNSTAIGQLPAVKTNTDGSVVFGVLTEDYVANILKFGATYTRDAQGAVIMQPLVGYPSSTAFTGYQTSVLDAMCMQLNNSNLLLNMVQDDPTPLDVIATATGMTGFDYYTDTNTNQITRWLYTCSVDVFTKFSITYTLYDNVGEEPTFKVTPYFTDQLHSKSDYNQLSQYMHLLHLLASFASHPAVRIIIANGNNTKLIAHNPFTQLIRPAIITSYNLANMHRTANLSYFDISAESFSRNNN